MNARLRVVSAALVFAAFIFQLLANAPAFGASDQGAHLAPSAPLPKAVLQSPGGGLTQATLSAETRQLEARGALPRPVPLRLSSHTSHRPVPVGHVTSPQGIRLAGPVIAIKSFDGRQAPTDVRSVVERYRTTLAPGAPIPTLRGRNSVHASTVLKTTASVDVTQPNVTGLPQWWAFAQGAMAGVGQWYVNTWYQNLVLQVVDLNVHYRGVNLAFVRTYNSYSKHTYEDADGASEIGQYGNGWTNTWDAHMSYNNSTAGGWSIFDVDGARYDYSYAANGSLVPPPGMEGTSLTTIDGGSFFWTKKDGSQLTFYAPYYPASQAAYNGRLYRISGRNRNSYIQFTYAWAGQDSSTSANLTNIYAQTDSGMTAVLWFSLFNGRRLLALLQPPSSGPATLYAYDSAGNLTTVEKPGQMNSSTPRYETYSGYLTCLSVAGSRWVYGSGNDGAFTSFTSPGSDCFGVGPTSPQVAAVGFYGAMNIAPADGTGTYLEPSQPTASTEANTLSISAQSGSTSISDSYGHGTIDYFDSVGRSNLHAVWSGSQWFTTWLYWDAHNNLIGHVDPRGAVSGVNQHVYQSDFEYDANDNLIAAAAPPVASSQGTFRPTKLLSYDSFNNVTASCDQVATHALGADWGNSPPPQNDSLCSGSGTTQMTYTYPSYEPNGELATVKTPAAAAAPSGYVSQISYLVSQQGGSVDYGLPTTVLGAATQDNNRTPGKNIFYDANGNLVCIGFGLGKWLFGYDSMNRVVSSADPDDGSPGTNGCTRGSAQSTNGQVWNTSKTISYYNDGTVASTQTPFQRAINESTQYQYDADLNVTSVSSQFGCTSAASCTVGYTKAWYDGVDRLVEVAKPAAAGDTTPWLTRYLYDFSSGGNVSASGVTLAAHGNQYDVQKYAPNGSWLDTGLAAYDTLDRIVTDYTFKPCPATGQTGAVYCNPAPAATTYNYDQGSVLGFLTSTSDPLNETRQFAYNAAGWQTAVQYAGDGGVTPAESLAYDPDGRVVQMGNALGAQTYAYDAAGNLLTATEPAALGGAVLTYGYYADNRLASTSAAWGALSQTNLFQYAYRADGMLASSVMNWSGSRTDNLTYTPAGRFLQSTDVLANASTSAQYDVYGRATAYNIPAGAYTSIAYDAMGDITGYAGYNGEAAARTYNTRGDQLSESFSPNPVTNGVEAWPAFAVSTVAGTIVQSSDEAYDARTGAVIAFGSQSFGYDAAGRMTSSPGAGTFTYDAENRLIGGNGDGTNLSEACGGGPASARRLPNQIRFSDSLSKYVYGPDGNVAQSVINTGEGTVTMGWHRDGNDLLFTDTGPGAPYSVYFGATGIVNYGDPGGLNMFDRDLDGIITSSHNASGYAAWSAPNADGQACVSSTSIPASVGYTPQKSLAQGFPSPLYKAPGLIDDGFNMSDGSTAVVGSALSSVTRTAQGYRSSVPLSTRRQVEGCFQGYSGPDYSHPINGDDSTCDPPYFSPFLFGNGSGQPPGGFHGCVDCAKPQKPLPVIGHVSTRPHSTKPIFAGASTSRQSSNLRCLPGQALSLEGDAVIPIVLMVGDVPVAPFNGGASLTVTNTGTVFLSPDFNVGVGGPPVGSFSLALLNAHPKPGQTVDDIANEMSLTGSIIPGLAGVPGVGVAGTFNNSGYMSGYVVGNRGLNVGTSWGFRMGRLPWLGKMFCS